MSMEIRGNYGSYAQNAASTAAKRSAESAKAKAPEKAEKTSQNDKTAAYYDELQKKYDCVKDGKVSISGAYLRQCANDPGKAKELEENLSFFKESCESGRKNFEAYARSLGAAPTSYEETWEIDETGNVTMIVSCSATDNSKSYGERKEEIDKLLAEKRAEKKAAEKQRQKKLEQAEDAEKLLEKMRAERTSLRTSVKIDFKA